MRQKLIFDLLLKALHGGPERRGNERRVDDSSSIGQIVSLDVALVVGCCQEVNPVWSVGGGSSWERGIAQRIVGVGLLSSDGEVGTGVGITTMR